MNERITSPNALAVVAKQNKGIFDATVARAPASVTFKGKTYPRAAADTVEKKLWFLAANAMTRPASVAGLANVAFTLDEVYGLDPDRSRLDMAQSALAAAKAKVSAATGRLNGLRSQLRQYEANLARAKVAQKEAQKVQIGDILTAGISAAGRNLYADGQVKIWQDRIESLKTGSLVGMAGQEGFQIPLNDGVAQNEAKLAEARAEVASATEELNEAQRSYDAEAKANRDAEAKAKREAAASAAEAARAEREAAALASRAEQEAAAAEAERNRASAEANAPVQTYPDTDPTGYVTDDGSYDDGSYDDGSYDDSAGGYEDESEMLDREQLAADLAGDEEFVFNEGGDDGDAALAGYVSPYGFDTYYGCDECRAGQYGCDDQCEGGCAQAARVRAEAMGLDDEGYGFDPSIIMVILSAVLALAPVIIGMFSPPTSAEDGNPSTTGNDPLSQLMGGLTGKNAAAEQARIEEEEAAKRNENLAWGAGALILLKVLA